MCAQPNRGAFIVIEGIDGAGTTTQGKILAERLKWHGRRAIFTSEPSEGPIGSLIRLALSGRVVRHDAKGTPRPLDPDTMALLFSADRLDHGHQIIEPALKSGTFVISDRYDLSTRAYQGLACDPRWIVEMNREAIRPDLTFLLKISPELALSRILDRPERSIYEKVAFLRKVESAYEALAQREPNCVILDGSLPVEEVGLKIWEEVLRRIKVAPRPTKKPPVKAPKAARQAPVKG